MTNQDIGRLLRMQAVLTLTGLSKTEIYRRISSGKFPPPIKLGTRAIAWPAAQIDAWIKRVIQDGSACRSN